jgi:hypothetical protein
MPCFVRLQQVQQCCGNLCQMSIRAKKHPQSTRYLEKTDHTLADLDAGGGGAIVIDPAVQKKSVVVWSLESIMVVFFIFATVVSFSKRVCSNHSMFLSTSSTK